MPAFPVLESPALRRKDHHATPTASYKLTFNEHFLCAKHCFQFFTSFTHPKKPMSKVLLLAPFHRWSNWRLDYVMQLGKSCCGRAEPEPSSCQSALPTDKQYELLWHLNMAPHHHHHEKPVIHSYLMIFLYWTLNTGWTLYLYNSSNYPTEQMLLSSSCYQWGNWSSEVNAQVTEVVSGS